MEYLLFTDETNQRPAADAKFFIYGGVFFPTDKKNIGISFSAGRAE
jgi:hypothetical protein